MPDINKLIRESKYYKENHKENTNTTTNEFKQNYPDFTSEESKDTNQRELDHNNRVAEQYDPTSWVASRGQNIAIENRAKCSPSDVNKRKPEEIIGSIIIIILVFWLIRKFMFRK